MFGGIRSEKLSRLVLVPDINTPTLQCINVACFFRYFDWNQDNIL